LGFVALAGGGKKLVGTDTRDGKEVYKLEDHPINSPYYSKVISYVATDTLLPLSPALAWSNRLVAFCRERSAHTGKHRVRRAIHPQLLQLFRTSPLLPKLDHRDWANWQVWDWPVIRRTTGMGRRRSCLHMLRITFRAAGQKKFGAYLRA
jgi:hypothetical protein